MTPITDVVLLLSLGANGMWLGNSIVQRFQLGSPQLVRATFGLLGTVIVLGIGVFVLHFHGAIYTIDKALCLVAIVACGHCCSRLMELLPRPWGNAPKKRKTSR